MKVLVDSGSGEGPFLPGGALQASVLPCWKGKLGPGLFQRLCPRGPVPPKGLPPAVFTLEFNT